MTETESVLLAEAVKLLRDLPDADVMAFLSIADYRAWMDRREQVLAAYDKLRASQSDDEVPLNSIAPGG